MKHNRQNHQKSNASSKAESGKQQVAVDENLKKFDAQETDTTDEKSVDAASDVEDHVDVSSSESSSSEESGLDKFTNQLLKMAPGIADASIEQARDTIIQALSTYQQARETLVQAKQTLTQAKSTIEEMRSSAKGAMSKIRSNPQPFFAAIAPGAIGAFLLVEKWRKSQMT